MIALGRYHSTARQAQARVEGPGRYSPKNLASFNGGSTMDAMNKKQKAVIALATILGGLFVGAPSASAAPSCTPIYVNGDKLSGTCMGSGQFRIKAECLTTTHYSPWFTAPFSYYWGHGCSVLWTASYQFK